MSNFIRTVILDKVVKTLQHVSREDQQKIMASLFIQYDNIGRKYSFFFNSKSASYDVVNMCKHWPIINLGESFDNIEMTNTGIYFSIERDKYVKKVVENNRFGVIPPTLAENKKNIVVEFSSPNIAKPFHFGHLRSTIIGNYIANVNTFLKHNVTRINYLGDWGTQVGYMLIGMQITNIHDKCLGDNALRELYNAYVTANKLAIDTPELHEEAKLIFKNLESGELTITKKWNEIKHLTVLGLEKTYKRIGITFDEYDWESMYSSNNIIKIINSMEDMQLLTLDSFNRKVICMENKEIPIIKSDGTNLYISRDIAAAIDRFERIKFDLMYYVVDYSQANHFCTLFDILNKMKLPWADRLIHVKFGRVHGMKTRTGTAVFLDDILDEAQHLMQLRQKNTVTTMVTESELDKSSDILGISNIIICNLRQRRMNNYEFNWSLAVDSDDNTGVKLQYTHCRLCRLEENFAETIETIPTECDPSILKEEEVDNLILMISKFDNAVLKSYYSAESYVLAIYLFHLCNAINLAFRTLKLKDTQHQVRNQRLLLFHVARLVLAQGMKLLGLTPLQRM